MRKIEIAACLLRLSASERPYIYYATDLIARLELQERSRIYLCGKSAFIFNKILYQESDWCMQADFLQSTDEF